MRGQAVSEQERQRLYLLTGVANYYGGRLSVRFPPDRQSAVIAAATAAAEGEADLSRTADDCTAPFLDFMRVVAGPQ